MGGSGGSGGSGERGRHCLKNLMNKGTSVTTMLVPALGVATETELVK